VVREVGKNCKSSTFLLLLYDNNNERGNNKNNKEYNARKQKDENVLE
jgi:hypothetical protein